MRLPPNRRLSTAPPPASILLVPLLVACLHSAAATAAEAEPAARTSHKEAAPPPGLLARAYREMLPFHGVEEPQDQENWLQRGMVRTLAVNLPACDWRSLARLMEAAQP